jgi:hypothetical protein
MTPDEMQKKIDQLRRQIEIFVDMAADWVKVGHENERLHAAIDRVRALHKQYEEGECGHCLMDEDGHFEPHPCPTLRAIDGEDA